MNKFVTIVLLIAVLSILASRPTSLLEKDVAPFKLKLSDYGFFDGKLNEQIPSAHVLPYSLNAPLFSDYAHKLRFVVFPDQTGVVFNPDSVFQFPVGTAIIKTFFYYQDERNLKKGRRLIETRILLHEPKGWISLPYVWDDLQADAFLEVAGGNTEVTWRDHQDTKRELNYRIPNMNQCKGCHERNGVMTPIGPTARQLNGDFRYPDRAENQLLRWKTLHRLTELPDDLKQIPALVNYDNPTEPFDARARAYLDVNCAHCHTKAGPARSAGLYLEWNTKDSTALGFFKTPVAAGRGSGNLAYDIVPGKPQESILLYRMQSLDPGVMMPELSRSLAHTEGIKLIREWIKTMED